MPSRRVVLTLSAIATLLLGLEKVGVVEVVPGADLRFEWSRESSPEGRPALVMRSDVGDFQCWIELIVSGNSANAGSFAATLPGGDPLAIQMQVVGPARLSLSISRAPVPPERVPFSWHAGVPLELARVGTPGDSLTVLDWTVYPNGQSSDSATRATLRRAWTWASWGFLILSLVGVATTTWAEKAEAPVTPVALVSSIVGSIEGDNEADTKRLRAFLFKVLLQGVTVDEALNSLKISKTPFHRRPRFQARARRLFLDRITLVKGELDAFAARV